MSAKIVYKDDPTVGEIGIESMSITYTQMPDSFDREASAQRITFTAVCHESSNPDIDNTPENYFYRITTPYDRPFAVNDKEELLAIFDDFERRFRMKVENRDEEQE